MATNSSILAWKIKSTQEHGGLQSMGDLHDLVREEQHGNTKDPK